MSLSNPFYLDNPENIRTAQAAQNLPQTSSILPSLRNTFWWVGNFGEAGGITANKNAHTWNNPLNWVVWNEGSQGSPWIPAPRVPGALTGFSDIVNIGAFTIGPTAYAPILFGGFSGSSTTGGYANSTGLTFDPGNTFTNIISNINIKWEYGAESKYPFTIVGGGIDVLYAFGVTSGSQTGCSAAPGVTFGGYYSNPHYKSLSLKSKEYHEESSKVNNKSIYINCVKAVIDEFDPVEGRDVTKPVGSFYKGSKYYNPSNPFDFRWGNSWNEGSSSRSKIWLTGFLAEIWDESRPSLNYYNQTSYSSPTKIKDDYGTTSQGIYGYPAIYVGFGEKGCTVGTYAGSNLCPISINNNSTVGIMSHGNVFSYTNSDGIISSLVGLPNYSLLVAGEVDVRKSFLALGYTAGQIVGQTGGGIFVVSTPEVPRLSAFGGSVNGVTSGPLFIGLGNPEYGSPGRTGVGFTGSSRIYNMEVQNWITTISSPTKLVLLGGLSSAFMTLDQTTISAYPFSQQSLFDIGSLFMNNYSELVFNAAPDINSWKFGVIPTTGATSQVSGGIFGDDTSVIKMSSGVSLYNKSLNRTTSPGAYKQTSANETLVIPPFKSVL